MQNDAQDMGEIEGRDQSGENDIVTPSDLFEQNIAAFEKRVPKIAQILRSHKPLSKLEIDDDGEMNVYFEGNAVFSRGARAEVDAKFENLPQHAARLGMSVSAKGLDNLSVGPHAEMLERAGKSGLNFTEQPVRTESYFLIVFGIGLGLHLDRLLELTNCRSLALIEPNVDFLYHSCFVYDWSVLLERMFERGTVDFILSTDTEESAARIHRIFRRDNPMCFDGSMVFRLYQSSLTKGIERRLQENLKTAVMGLGFFQDEINMIAQTYKNLESGTARMAKRVKENPGMPCFVVGNGPSLEKLLPFIEKNADNAIIFSCGSALETLLGAGIQPDFWVMMERGDLVLDLTKETASKFDTTNIRLVGSTTVFPGLQELFKDPLLFFRPGLSSTPLFATDQDQILLMPDPLSANAGLAVASHLGFRELYLIGVDVGSRRAESSHTPGGWYDRLSSPYGELSLSAPGNFGGEVWTTPTLQWSKECLEQLIRSARGRRYYNLSDGAAITGAVPLHHRAVKLGKQSDTKENAIQSILDACPVYERATFDQRWEEVALVDNLHEFAERLKSATNDMEDFRFEFEIAKLLRPNHSDNALEMLLRGTLFTFLIGWNVLNNRLADPSDRPVFDDLMKEAFSGLVDRMANRATEIFLDVEAGAPWEKSFEA